MASQPLAKTTFQGGPDDTLAAVDAYDNPPQEPIGGTTAVGSAKLLDIGDLGGGILNGGFGGGFLQTGSRSDKLGNLGTLGGGFKDLKTSIATVTNILNGDKSFLNDVKDNMLGDMLASVGYMPEDLGSVVSTISATVRGEMDPLQALALNNPKLKIIMDGVETIRSAKDIDSIDDIFNVVGKLTGNSQLAEILHIGPEMSLIKGLVDKAMDLGIPGLVNALMGHAESRGGREFKDSIRLQTANSAAKNSQLTYLDELLEDFGGLRLTSMTPHLVSTLLSSYKIPKEANGIASQQLANELVDMCLKIDENFDTELRDGTYVPSLRNFTKLSDDAKAVLMKYPKYIPYVLAGPHYKKVSLRDINNNRYPYMPKLDEFGSGLRQDTSNLAYSNKPSGSTINRNTSTLYQPK